MPSRPTLILALILATATPVAAAGETAALKVQEAAAAMVRGNTSQAVVLYSEALADPSLPNDRRATVLTDRGVAYVRLGQTRLAFEDFNRAVQLFPEYAAVYNNRGNLLLALGVIKEALKDFDRALVLAPGYASAYNNRAGAYLQLGDHEAAIRDYTRAVQLMPQGAAPLTGRGRAHLAKGRPHAAIRDFSRAVGTDARFAAAYRDRAQAKIEVAHYEEAIEDLSRAVAVEVGNAELYLARGHAYLALGNHASAIKDFSHAIEHAPGKASGYSGRGLAHALAGAVDEGLSDLNRAIELEPRSASAFACRAIGYKLADQVDIARTDVDTAMKLDAEDPYVLWARAEVAEAQGDTAAAVDSLRKALAKRPSFKVAADALERLTGGEAVSGEVTVAGLGHGRWRVVMRDNRYYAASDDYKRLRVPLEMIGEGQPKILGFELREAPLKGIGVLTFSSGMAQGPRGEEPTEQAAILDLTRGTVVAVQPHRQGEKVASWTWSEGKVTVASVDGVTDEHILREVRPRETVAEGQPRRRYSSAEEDAESWNQPWAAPRPQGSRQAQQRKKKPKTIFDLIFGF